MRKVEIDKINDLPLPKHTKAEIKLILKRVQKKELAKKLGVSKTAITYAFQGKLPSLLEKIEKLLEETNGQEIDNN